MNMEETTLWNKVNPTYANLFALDFVNMLERSSYGLTRISGKLSIQVNWSKRDESELSGG